MKLYIRKDVKGQLVICDAMGDYTIILYPGGPGPGDSCYGWSCEDRRPKNYKPMDNEIVEFISKDEVDAALSPEDQKALEFGRRILQQGRSVNDLSRRARELRAKLKDEATQLQKRADDATAALEEERAAQSRSIDQISRDVLAYLDAQGAGK